MPRAAADLDRRGNAGHYEHMTTPPDPLVHNLVAALDQYRKARDEQHMNFATRPPDDLEDAADGVRKALAELLADLQP